MVNLSKKSLENKNKLLNKFFTVIVCGKEYDFKIKHVNRNDIVIQKKFYFEELTSNNGKDSFEFNIQYMITDSDDMIDNSEELRIRASSNKDKLMRKMFSLPIGDKKHGFRIVQITQKYIRIENILKYELIDKIYTKGIISLEYILHELILDNPTDYSLFKDDVSTESVEDLLSDHDNSEESLEISIDVGDIDKLTPNELDSKLTNVKGWQKLVFDSIDNYGEDVFTLEILEKEEIYDPFRFQGESLIPTIEKNLYPLVDLGLVKKFDDKHFVKLW